MKKHPFAPVVAYIALSITTVFPQVGYAEDTPLLFLCSTTNSVPATIARTPHGDVPIVFWNSPDLGSSDATLIEQCEEVSRRFQTRYNDGTFNYITTGIIDGQLVTCAAQSQGGACSEPLFNLQDHQSESASPPSRPSLQLQRILRIRVPTDGPIHETPPRIYIDLERYLNGGYRE
jgi:hypothetical protein